MSGSKIVRHASRIIHQYGHETAIAAVPLVVDFHFYIFIISISAIVALYVFEEIVQARGGG